MVARSVGRWLPEPRPGSLFGPAGLDLPRRTAMTPSPVDWRNEVLYFLLVDRFSDGQEATRPLLDRARLADFRPAGWRWDSWARSGAERWQGGTLAGVASKLGYLADLGVTTLWLSPVFRQRGHLDTYHGYGVQDFLDVDPRFGTRQELAELVAAAHQRGMRVLLDIIFNHSGSNWRYRGDTWGQYADGDKVPYTSGRYPFGDWNDASGQRTAHIAGAEDGVWPAELQDTEAYTRAGSGSFDANDDATIANPAAEHKRTDFEDLRDFALDQRLATGGTVLNALAACYKYWIALTDCDGFRIDTLKHVSMEQARNFCGIIKEYAATLGKQNFFLLGEVAGGDWVEDGYLRVLERNLDAVLDIGNMRLALEAVSKGMTDPNRYFAGFDPGNDRMGSHRTIGSRHVSVYDDHDHVWGNKLRVSVDAASDHQVVAGVAMQLFTLGIPCVYYGTEQALAGPEASERNWLPEWNKSDRYLRETLFGAPHPRMAGRAGLQPGALDLDLPGFGPFGTAGAHAFDPGHPAYRRIAALCAVRRDFPVLRFGRQYRRPVSLFGGPFNPLGAGELLPWSRILDDEEALCVVNPHGTAARGGDVLVDPSLAATAPVFRVIANSAEAGGVAAVTHPVGSTLPVRWTPDGTAYVEIRDVPASEALVLTNR